jgi:hypothetical protein
VSGQVEHVDVVHETADDVENCRDGQGAVHINESRGWPGTATDGDRRFSDRFGSDSGICIASRCRFPTNETYVTSIDNTHLYAMQILEPPSHASSSRRLSSRPGASQRSGATAVLPAHAGAEARWAMACANISGSVTLPTPEVKACQEDSAAPADRCSNRFTDANHVRCRCAAGCAISGDS